MTDEQWNSLTQSIIRTCFETPIRRAIDCCMTQQALTIRRAVPTYEEGIAFARFMNQAASGQYRLLFGPRHTDIAATAYQKPNHDLSYERVLFAEIDGILAGMASAYTAEQHNRSSDRPLLEAAGRSATRIMFLYAVAAPIFRFLHACDDDDFYLQFLAVDPSHRGRGVGTALIQAMEARARKTGAVRYTLDAAARNHVARHLYEKRGFQVTDRWPHFKILPPNILRMTKVL